MSMPKRKKTKEQQDNEQKNTNDQEVIGEKGGSSDTNVVSDFVLVDEEITFIPDMDDDLDIEDDSDDDTDSNLESENELS